MVVALRRGDVKQRLSGLDHGLIPKKLLPFPPRRMLFELQEQERTRKVAYLIV